MRLTSVKEKTKPVTIGLETAYFFRTQFINPKHTDKPLCVNYIRNSKDLIDRWDLVQTQWTERVYLDTIVDDTDTAFGSIIQGRSTTLVSFFTSQMIDIPVCLAKIKFSHSSTASNPRTRLISMLTRHGRRYSVSKAYSMSALRITRNHFQHCSHLPTSKRWELAYLIFAQRKVRWDKNFCALSHSSNPSPYPELLTSHNKSYTPEHRLTSACDWFNDRLFDEISSHYPAFSLFVQRVNKLKRRHSRGKSGQYEIIWKYVPQYKRLLVVLRWLIRDVQFQRPKTFQQRLEKSLETFLFDK